MRCVSDIAVHREFYDGEVSFFDPTRQEAMVDALEAAFERVPGWHPRISRVRPSPHDVGREYSDLFRTIEVELKG